MSSTTPYPGAPARWTSLIRAIADGPNAWASPEQLGERLARPIQETAALIDEMERAGWLAAWNRPDGPAVTLSAWAAERFGYRLIEIGRFGATRWAPIEAPEPPPPRARGVVRANSAALEDVADDAPTPDQELEWLNPPPPKSITRRLGRDGRHLAVRPRLLIGLGFTWPGPARSNSSREDCPACGSRLLPPHAYCLYCDRSGADDPGAKPRRHGPKPNPERGAADPAAIEAERQRRKQRRRERRAKRLEEERRRREDRNREREKE